jgi:hypothetical protein
MAIEFDTGTINAANAGAVGAAMLDKIRDNLVAHPAWELVEEYTPPTTVKWKVFKCLAAVSGLPNDFYAIFCINIGSGRIRLSIAEGYVAGTHTMSLYPTTVSSSSSSTLKAYDAQGRQTADTFVLASADWSGFAPSPRYIEFVPSGVSTKYWTTIDDDGFSIGFNGAANEYMHCGAFDWLGSLANACPLHLAGSAGGLYHSFTRNPACAGPGNFGPYALAGTFVGTGSSTPANVLGMAGRLDRNDKFVNDQRAVAEIGVARDFENTVGHVNGMEVLGWVMGKFKRLRYGTNPPAGFAFGDAYAHNGTLWVPYIASSGFMWDTGVAA